MQNGKKSRDPLDALFDNSDPADDRLLAEVLTNRITLLPQGDFVRLTDSFAAREGIVNKLIAIALGRHVLLRKNKIKEADLAKDAEWFAKCAQERPKYVLETLSRLKGKENLFERVSNGYQIPIWAVRSAIVFLKNGKRKAKRAKGNADRSENQ